MITLDQVQMLEKKVETIVLKMNDLQKQNSSLQEKNRNLIEENSILKQKISSFEADQNRIEQGILNALDRLNSMENSVLKVGSSAIAEPIQQNTYTQKNIQQDVESSQENTEVNPESSQIRDHSHYSQETNLTDFSSITDSEQNQTEMDENTFKQESPSLEFSDENINEVESSSNSDEQSLSFGLDLDFDSNVEENYDSQNNSSQSQLGIF